MSKKLLLLVVVAMLATVAFADVNVTFRANTSVIEGICDTLGGIDLRGTVTQWGPGTNMTNVGGDYWEITIQLAAGDYEYKYGGQVVDLMTGTETDYWENDLPGAVGGAPNRTLTVGDEDMVLDLDYVGVTQGEAHPYLADDPAKNDVLFRVNMGGLNGFNADEDHVYMVGAFPGPDGAENMWDPAKYEMTREGESDYYHFTLSLDTIYAATMYRYTLGSWDMSENVRGHGVFPDNENRGTAVNSDTTIAWKWWNDAPPAAVNGDTVAVTFKVDLNKAIDNNGFIIGDGDSLCVRVGYFNTAQYVEVGMQKVGIAGFNYEASIDELVIEGLGEGVYYQYYKIPGSTSGETRETYFNFDYEGSTASEAERRYVIIDADGQIVEDVVDSKTDSRRMPEFRNTNSVSQDVEVTYTLDLRPAYVHVANGVTLSDIQGNLDIETTDQIDELGVFMNGPAAGGWTGWGTTLSGTESQKMWDDGTHGDAVAGDTIYTVIFTYGPDSTNNTVGQEFKFGIGGGDNESSYGLNHIENVDDTQASSTIHSQWGSINPNFYSLWDFDTQSPKTAIDTEVDFAETFELSQNYPNPFNPTTNIKFSTRNAQNVYLTIYNMLGHKVQEMHYSNLNAGVYNYTWNAVDMTGSRVGSGIYFYKLQVDDKYTNMKKMILLK